jgi:hypothetical protein
MILKNSYRCGKKLPIVGKKIAKEFLSCLGLVYFFMKIEAFPVKILSDGIIITDYARRLLPSKDKVRLRRDKIIQSMADGMTQEEISMEVKCSLSTIEKDIKAIRDGL